MLATSSFTEASFNTAAVQQVVSVQQQSNNKQLQYSSTPAGSSFHTAAVQQQVLQCCFEATCCWTAPVWKLLPAGLLLYWSCLLHCCCPKLLVLGLLLYWSYLLLDCCCTEATCCWTAAVWSSFLLECCCTEAACCWTAVKLLVGLLLEATCRTAAVLKLLVVGLLLYWSYLLLDNTAAVQQPAASVQQHSSRK